MPFALLMTKWMRWRERKSRAIDLLWDVRAVLADMDDADQLTEDDKDLQDQISRFLDNKE